MKLVKMNQLKEFIILNVLNPVQLAIHHNLHSGEYWLVTDGVFPSTFGEVPYYTNANGWVLFEAEGMTWLERTIPIKYRY
jgi:hypothetical protein